MKSKTSKSAMLMRYWWMKTHAVRDMAVSDGERTPFVQSNGCVHAYAYYAASTLGRVMIGIRFVCNVRYQALHGFKRTRISYKLAKRKEKA